MTDRNELERLLEAATEGPWAVDGPPYNQIIWSGPESRVAFMAHSDGCDVERDKATAALICFLRNNAQHYLSLMDKVERLKTENEAAGRNVAQLQRDGVKFCEALRKCSDLVRRYNGRQTEKLDDIPAIVSQALGETHDR